MLGGSPPLSTLNSHLLSPPSNKKEKSCALLRTVTSPFFISLLKQHLVRSHFALGSAHCDDV